MCYGLCTDYVWNKTLLLLIVDCFYHTLVVLLELSVGRCRGSKLLLLAPPMMKQMRQSHIRLSIDRMWRRNICPGKIHFLLESQPLQSNNYNKNIPLGFTESFAWHKGVFFPIDLTLNSCLLKEMCVIINYCHSSWQKDI